MRIGLFHNLLSGGAKRAVYEWTRRLARDHHVEVHTLETADHRFCDIRPLVQAHEEYRFAPSRLFASPWGRLNQVQRWRDLGRLTALSRRIAARMNGRGYDVVFANTCRFTFIPALLQFLRCPTVYFLHEPFGRAARWPSRAPVQPAGGLRRWLDQVDPLIALYRRGLDGLQRRSLAATGRLLANSSFTARSVYDAYGVETPVCRYGVDADAFRRRNGFPRGDHVLSVGEMSPRKGFDFLIEALALLPPASRPALRLACNAVLPAEREHLERLAAVRDVRLEIRTNVATTELAREYSEAAMCVYAPVNEPFGLVPLEAMACETAVVAVGEGGVPESVVAGRTGVLVPRDPARFAEAVAGLLADPSHAADLGRNGRAHVLADWSWDRSAADLAGHLASVARPAPVGHRHRREDSREDETHRDRTAG